MKSTTEPASVLTGAPPNAKTTNRNQKLDAIRAGTIGGKRKRYLPSGP